MIPVAAWSDPERSPWLAPRTTLIWCVALDGPLTSAVDAALAALPASDQARSARFRSPADRRRHLLAVTARRLVLALHLRRPPACLRLVVEPRGKPGLDRLPGDADLRFSVSHTGNLALVAVAAGIDVGVDVERERCLPDMLSVARRFLGDDCARRLAELPTSEQPAAFLMAWTRAEAFLKALGVGWTGPDAGLALPAWVSLPAAVDSGWRVATVRPRPGCVASVVARGESDFAWLDVDLARLAELAELL